MDFFETMSRINTTKNNDSRIYSGRLLLFPEF